MDKVISSDFVTLYYSPTAFLSQKVALALYEKNISFQPRVINLAARENEEPWFLKINPKGRVPVLKHGEKIITVATTIIDYLDRNFSGPRMFPNFTQEEGRLAEKYHIMFTNISVEMMTYRLKVEDEKYRAGCDPNAPSTPQFCVSGNRGGGPISVDIEVRTTKTPAPDHGIEDLLNLLHNAFSAVEKQLKSWTDNGHPEYWLCGANFNIADIVLTLILHRTKLAGWASCTWEDGTHPYLERYFCLVRLRDSFRAVLENYCDDSSAGKNKGPSRSLYGDNCTGNTVCKPIARATVSAANDPCNKQQIQVYNCETLGPTPCDKSSNPNRKIVVCKQTTSPCTSPCSPGVMPMAANTSISTGIYNTKTCVSIPDPCGCPGDNICQPGTDDGSVEFECHDGTKVRCKPGACARSTVYRMCDETGCSEAVVINNDECCPDYTTPVLIGCSVLGFSAVAAYFIYKAIMSDEFDVDMDFYCPCT